MANTNTLTEAVPQILAQGMLALRGKCILPALVNSDYSAEASEKGDTIDVPIPSAITVQAVTPSYVPPDDTGIVPTKVAILLDKWNEAPFFLNDKEIQEAIDGILPMQASEAIKSVAREVNKDLFACYSDALLGVYGYTGTAGTTPFASDTSAARNARKILNEQLAYDDDRRIVLDTDADAAALGLSAIADASAKGDKEALKEGKIGRVLGFDWYYDAQVPTHTSSGGTGWLVNQVGHVAIGDTTVIIDTGSGDPLVGDIFTVAGDTQTYCVTIYAANTITFNRPALVAWQDNAAITFKASHVVNLAFHRDALAFATRTLEVPGDGMGSIIRSVVDPVSKLTLRLEVSRQHKRTRWSFDILYGCKLVRAELACRIAG